MSIDREQHIGKKPELTSREAAVRFVDFISDPENFSIPGFHDGYKSAFEVTSEMRHTREWELGIAYANCGVSLMKAKFLKIIMNSYGPDVYIASKWIAKVIDFDPNTYQLRPQPVEKSA